MANRARGNAAGQRTRDFKPTLVTRGEFEELVEKVNHVLAQFGTRLAITEFALQELIQDVYYAEDGELPEEDGEPEGPDEPEAEETPAERELRLNANASDATS